MGPKSEPVKSVRKSVSLDDAINTDDWKCIVAIAVEKNPTDNFVIQSFCDGASTRLRQQVVSINYQTDVLGILRSLLQGELEYRYGYLMNFLSVFMEAAETIRKEPDSSLPLSLLVKIMKALIFTYKQENLERREKESTAVRDPIKAMAARPPNPSVAVKAKDVAVPKKGKKEPAEKKTEKTETAGIKIKPFSPGKEDSKLLKRNEGVKQTDCIDDAPTDSCFDLYILLSGFYDAEFPLELVKADVPLHGLFCIDASHVQNKKFSSSTSFRVRNRESSLGRSSVIPDFWYRFLRILWTPHLSPHFNEVIFQVYTPEFLPSDKEKLEKLLYSEISYLLYDISDIDRKRKHYIHHMKLWDVSERVYKFEPAQEFATEVDKARCGSVLIPVVVQCLLDQICGEDGEPETPENEMFAKVYDEECSEALPESDESVVSAGTLDWSFIIDGQVRKTLHKAMKSLDEQYDVKSIGLGEGADVTDIADKDDCNAVKKWRLSSPNVEAALICHETGGLLGSFWSSYQRSDVAKTPVSDYSRFIPGLKIVPCAFDQRLAKRLHVSDEAALDMLTVTGSSRSVLKNQPPHVSKEFFALDDLKIVNPSTLRAFSCSYVNFSQSDDSIVDTSGFDFVEEFTKSKMVETCEEAASHFMCVDHVYSAHSDSLLFLLHNRMNSNGTYREPHNVTLRTSVGLRDFFDYVMDDERDWLVQEERKNPKSKYRSNVFPPNSLYQPTPDFRDFDDDCFISENSLKYHKLLERVGDRRVTSEPVVESSKSLREDSYSLDRWVFDGYDVGNTAVQFSGLRTVFYGTDNCSVRVELSERLYGSQQLGVHVRKGGHLLNMYSFVCPKPHVSDSFCCHVTLKNGVIIAFEKQTEVFGHRMKLSLPSGLTVEPVFNGYVKQSYVSGTTEISRLFFPNGTIVKMNGNGTAEAMRIDTSVVKAHLDGLNYRYEFEYEYGCEEELEMSEKLGFENWEVITVDGRHVTVENGDVTTEGKLNVLINVDVETKTEYFQRLDDGTNFAFYKDGSLCVQFRDGTKMASSVYEEREDLDGFVSVQMKIVMEHEDYVTVIYDSATKAWTISLPLETSILVHPNGSYSATLDQRTELHILENKITMVRLDKENVPICRTTADLSVFETENPRSEWCVTEDCTNRKFVVESSANCYVTSRGSETLPEMENGFSKQNRYFVLRRNLTGFKLTHRDDVVEALEKTGRDTMLYATVLPGPESLRCFVLLTPVTDNGQGCSKWKVKSTIPDPKYIPRKITDLKRSTYGDPPSWMHPFPIKRTPVEIPERVAARVFIEIKTTDICPIPTIGKFAFCQLDEIPEKKPEDLLRSVADNDQDTLLNLYRLAVKSKMDAVKNTKSVNTKALDHYLKMSKRCVELEKYHKHSIRFKDIPNYFEHPSGLSWLILNELIEKIKPREQVEAEPAPTTSPRSIHFSPSSRTTELEYDLEFPSCKSFSSLSYLSDLLLKSAPSQLTRACTCRFKSKIPRLIKSEPRCFKPKRVTELRSSLQSESSFSRPENFSSCSFTEEQLTKLQKQ